MPAAGRNGAPLIPVTILTGFLGSGKTTLLNHILNDNSHGMRFAVIENEFGDVGVDEKVLSKNVDDEVIEVMNGCICCCVRGDLVEALQNLYKRVASFDGIIVETTGLADPAPVCQTFFLDTDIQSKYKLDSVITVVDAKHIMDRIFEKKPDGVVNEAIQQVAFADKILLNKVDLVTDNEALGKIENELQSINPTASIQRTQQSRVNPKDIINIHAFDITRVVDFDPDFLEQDRKPTHDSAVTSVAVKVRGDVNMMMLKTWIDQLIYGEGANLYRYKGVISVKGIDEKFVFQGVGMLFHGAFDDICWKEGEKRESRFVFIGKDLDHSFYRNGFLACRDDTSLRFEVGTQVWANVGDGYHQGMIVQQWDDGHAYRIQLHDEERTLVRAPLDLDHYVCAVISDEESE